MNRSAWIAVGLSPLILLICRPQLTRAVAPEAATALCWVGSFDLMHEDRLRVYYENLYSEGWVRPTRVDPWGRTFRFTTTQEASLKDPGRPPGDYPSDAPAAIWYSPLSLGPDGVPSADDVVVGAVLALPPGVGELLIAWRWPYALALGALGCAHCLVRRRRASQGALGALRCAGLMLPAAGVAWIVHGSGLAHALGKSNLTGLRWANPACSVLMAGALMSYGAWLSRAQGEQRDPVAD